MVVLIVETAGKSLRGLLSRWLIEPRAGVFVGRLSARVRDELWKIVISSGRVKGALMLYSAQTEQGFTIRSYGDTTRDVVDYDGLFLIRQPMSGKVWESHYKKRGHEKTENE